MGGRDVGSAEQKQAQMENEATSFVRNRFSGTTWQVGSDSSSGGAGGGAARLPATATEVHACVSGQPIEPSAWLDKIKRSREAHESPQQKKLKKEKWWGSAGNLETVSNGTQTDE